MDTMTDADALAVGRTAVRWWWAFLLAGIAWVLIACAILTVDPTTPAAIGYLVGFVLIAAGVNELVSIAFVDSWKWLYGVLGALFLLAGILALTEPFQTFGLLAVLIGWYLVFKGTMDIVLSIMERGVLPLWGLTLASGILELIIGIWALGYPGRSAWLVIVWIGIGALVRGITEIVFAFKLRGLRAAVA
jgi:uncharacterized membrane protein HdeD (DUF308 family)